MLYIGKMREQISFLPKFIIVWVIDNLLPEEIIPVILLSSVFQWPNFQIKIEAIFWLLSIEAHNLVIVPTLTSWFLMLVAEHCKSGNITLQKCPLVVEIIEEKIRDGLNP